MVVWAFRCVRILCTALDQQSPPRRNWDALAFPSFALLAGRFSGSHICKQNGFWRSLAGCALGLGLIMSMLALDSDNAAGASGLKLRGATRLMAMRGWKKRDSRVGKLSHPVRARKRKRNFS